MSTTIRGAARADLPAVKAIYDDQVRTAVATFDTSPPDLEHWSTRLESRGVGDHMVVAERDGLVVGYAYSSTYRPRPAYDRTRETSVYLGAPARGRGLGRALYDELLGRLRHDDVHLALAVVALPNDPSEALHRACGFALAGRLPEVGRKFDRWIDTALYALVLR